MTTIDDIEIKLRDAEELKNEIGSMILGCVDEQLAKIGINKTIDILSGRIGAYRNACRDSDYQYQYQSLMEIRRSQKSE